MADPPPPPRGRRRALPRRAGPADRAAGPPGPGKGTRTPGGRRAARGRHAGETPAIEPQRIAKLLARAGAGSRRDIERMIAEGRVAIGGARLTTPATIVSSLEGVTVDGRPVTQPEGTRLFLFHKPAGVLTAARDPGGRPTIYDVLPAQLPRLVPVGRLDLNTEGLLLLTNDGAFKRALELPSSAVPRTYRVRAMGQVRQSDLEQLALGVELDGMRYGPVDASVDRRATAGGANIWLTMTLTEGKNREVRRLCEAMGLKVSRLIRVAYGPFLLGELPPRGIGEVPADTVRTFRAHLKMSQQPTRQK